MSVEVMSGGGSANLQSKSILPSSLPYTASPDSGYDGFSGLTVQKPSLLLPENIKSGVSLFGVIGSYTATPILITAETSTSTSSVLSLTFPHTFSNEFSDVTNAKLFAFSLGCGWSGTLNTGDFFGSKFISLGTDGSSILTVIKMNDSNVEKYWSAQYRSLDGDYYRNFYITLAPTYITISLPPGSSDIRFRANSTYSFTGWFS